MEWQPIETAPKFGVILGYHPNWYDIATPMFWKGGRWVFFHDHDSDIHATHWMPMLKPPAGA